MSQALFEKAQSLIDSANNEDPNKVTDSENKEWPKEALYAHHMSDMLECFKPETDDVMKLAIRAQHIQRWKSPILLVNCWRRLVMMKPTSNVQNWRLEKRH